MVTRCHTPGATPKVDSWVSTHSDTPRECTPLDAPGVFLMHRKIRFPKGHCKACGGPAWVYDDDKTLHCVRCGYSPVQEWRRKREKKAQKSVQSGTTAIDVRDTPLT